MDINNTMDIDGAKLQIKAMRDAKMLEVQALDVCLATLDQTFAPQFTELEQVKAENASLVETNTALQTENSTLQSVTLESGLKSGIATPQ